MNARAERLPLGDEDLEGQQKHIIDVDFHPEVPQQEEVPIESSIGPTWPPRPTSQDRIKGFEVRHLVRDAAQLQEYAVLIQHARAGTLGEYLRERFPKELANENLEYTRFSFRFIVENTLLTDVYAALGSSVEVVIPLGGSDEFDGYSMVYIGHNAESRQPNPDDLAEALANVRVGINRQPKTYAEIKDRVREGGYEVKIPTMEERLHDTALREEVAKLYALFGWNEESVFNMLAAENNVLGVVRKNGKVVSAGIAEIAKIHIMTEEGPKEFRMAELTEASTLKDEQGNGLYTALAADLLRALVSLQKDKQPHIALGESNGLSKAVLKAARDLNRTFAYEFVDAEQPVLGYLPQHVPIDTPGRRAPMNDLFPAYISRATMREFAGVE